VGRKGKINQGEEREWNYCEKVEKKKKYPESAKRIDKEPEQVGGKKKGQGTGRGRVTRGGLDQCVVNFFRGR